MQAFHGVLIAPSHLRNSKKELEKVNGLRMAAPEDVHRSQMALASSRQAKLPTLPVVQQNDPIGYYVANIVYVISFTSWLPPLTRLVTCQGQLPAFIDVLGKKLDAADEMLVYNSATKKKQDSHQQNELAS